MILVIISPADAFGRSGSAGSASTVTVNHLVPDPALSACGPVASVAHPWPDQRPHSPGAIGPKFARYGCVLALWGGDHAACLPGFGREAPCGVQLDSFGRDGSGS